MTIAGRPVARTEIIVNFMVGHIISASFLILFVGCKVAVDGMMMVGDQLTLGYIQWRNPTYEVKATCHVAK